KSLSLIKWDGRWRSLRGRQYDLSYRMFPSGHPLCARVDAMAGSERLMACSSAELPGARGIRGPMPTLFAQGPIKQLIDLGFCCIIRGFALKAKRLPKANDMSGSCCV
ncbi:MAG: hypothetical protein M0P52_05205, partial [Rhodoferax sp.]|nr:hypothetical protein [Rhodoferax sp.]